MPPSSEFYVQAKLFEGATHVREYKAKPAVESFKEVLRVGAESTTRKVKPFEDLANLSLARTFYSTGQYELAAKYFDRVSHGIVRLAQQPVRGVVGQLHAASSAGYSKALGNIHTLQAPYFDNFVKPESVGRGPDRQGDHLLLQLPVRPRARTPSTSSTRPTRRCPRS